MVIDVAVLCAGGDAKFVGSTVGFGCVGLCFDEFCRAREIGHCFVEFAHADVAVSAKTIESGIIGMFRDAFSEYANRVLKPFEVAEPTTEPDDGIGVAWCGFVGALCGCEVGGEGCAFFGGDFAREERGAAGGLGFGGRGGDGCGRGCGGFGFGAGGGDSCDAQEQRSCNSVAVSRRQSLGARRAGKSGGVVRNWKAVGRFRDPLACVTDTGGSCPTVPRAWRNW